jgi:hypothetical protein
MLNTDVLINHWRFFPARNFFFHLTSIEKFDSFKDYWLPLTFLVLFIENGGTSSPKMLVYQTALCLIAEHSK